MAFTYQYPRPGLTVDAILFGVGQGLQVLLIRRNHDPFKGKWAFPGGFVEIDESLEDAVLRELQEETGISEVCLEQFHTFGAVDRDPRDRVVAVAYQGLVKPGDHRIEAASDASEAAWHPVSKTRGLAFDHDRVLAMALGRLRDKVRHRPLGLGLLPPRFTLLQLQGLYEAILGTPLNKAGFRRMMLRLDFLVAAGQVSKERPDRAARLYRFDRKKYQQLQERGFHLEIG